MPRWSLERSAAATSLSLNEKCEEEQQHGTDPPEVRQLFTVRHLKQGATGAVKTWPVAEVLLHYLVRRDGFRDVSQKILGNQTLNARTLDLTTVSTTKSEAPSMRDIPPIGDKCYNIVE